MAMSARALVYHERIAGNALSKLKPIYFEQSMGSKQQEYGKT